MFLTWADIREEVLRRIGRRQVNWRPRGEHFTESAFRLVATWFHHPSLDERNSAILLNAGDADADLPADWQHVMFVRLLDAAGVFIRNLTKEKISSIAQRSSGASSDLDPKIYTIFANTILVERAPSSNRLIDIWYFTKPTAPDFTTPTSFDLDLVWVEPTIVLATALGHKATFRPDLATQQIEHFQYLTQQIPTAVLVRDLMMQLSEAPERAIPGHQGARA